MPRVATEETLTMTPPPCSTRVGSTARQHHRVGINERVTSAAISLSLNSVNGLKLIAPPTLLIRISMRPKRSTLFAITSAAPAQVSRSACSRSEEHTSELQSRPHLVCRLLLEKKKNEKKRRASTRDVTPAICGVHSYAVSLRPQCQTP